MDRIELVRKILRSLCANTSEEEIVALENYRNTRIDLLGLTGNEQKFLDVVSRYFRRFGGPPSISAIQQNAVDNVDTILKVYAGEVASENQLWGANYAGMLACYVELHLDQGLTRTLVDITQIKNEGKQVGKELQRGSIAAIEHAILALTKLKRNSNPYQRPWTREEALQVLREQYAQRMANPVLSYGLGMGLSPIDEATKGAQNKELWMVAGFTSQGKSTWLLNWSRYLAYEGGFNVLYYSLEMDREQIWRILACGHCAHPKFGRPLNYEQIKSGTLSPEDADFYLNEVLPDLGNMSGHIEVANPAGSTSMDEIQAEAEIVNRERPLDLVIIDYIAVVSASKEQKRLGKQDRINENIIRAKQIATEFNHGAGLVVASAHQINRVGYQEAQKNGGVYEIKAIADANEVERSSDVLLCIYQDDPMKQKKEATITNLKNRDGRIVSPFNIYFPGEFRLVAELERMDESQLAQLLEA